MKKFRITALLLLLTVTLTLLSACAREDEEKPMMSLNVVLAIADDARNVPITYFSNYEYIVLGSSELPLYYFPLRESDFAFSVGMGEDGLIESMMLSHVSGDSIYLFHKKPANLDENAAQYTEDAKSYAIQKFIDKMTEN